MPCAPAITPRPRQPQALQYICKFQTKSGFPRDVVIQDINEQDEYTPAGEILNWNIAHGIRLLTEFYRMDIFLFKMSLSTTFKFHQNHCI